MKFFVVLIGLFVFSFLATVTKAQPGGDAPTPVFVAEVKRASFTDEIEALGTLQANENVNLTSTVTERVTTIHFQDNQRVAKGDLLVEMDAAEEEAELAEEQSRVNEAQRQVNRLRPLVQRGAASQSALDEQQRELNIARARINAIQSRIDERKIKAPFDGVVGIRNISVGALAQPGTHITTIDDVSVMKLDFDVPEIFLSSLQPGIKVNARTSAYPERVFTGEVSSIESRVDPITRSVSVRAFLDNADGVLKSGMLMRVEIRNNPRQALIIPEESVITSGTQNSVMVIGENEEGQTIVNAQPVEIGARRAGDVEILSGLNEGQKIVTHGTLRVRPGAAVTIKAVETNDETLTELLEQSAPAQGDAQ